LPTRLDIVYSQLMLRHSKLRSWLTHCATIRKVEGSISDGIIAISDGIIEIFH